MHGSNIMDTHDHQSITYSHDLVIEDGQERNPSNVWLDKISCNWINLAKDLKASKQCQKERGANTHADFRGSKPKHKWWPYQTQ